MNTQICTLFEGAYHIGCAALVNSLYRHGYRGKIIAGYRGELPDWAAGVSERDDGWQLDVAEGLSLLFVPLAVKSHLTNFKPQFMLDIWGKSACDFDSLFYFDPDIVVSCEWRFFQHWVESGVALCQDVNGSMPNNHPIRNSWRKLMSKQGMQLANRCDVYINGGYIGVNRRDRRFLELWREVIDIACNDGADIDVLTTNDRTNPFMTPDQDALNIAVMETDADVSYVGQDGMDFQSGGGGYIMSHAVGPRKPWNHCYTLAALRGRHLGRACRQFLTHLNGPIFPYSKLQMVTKSIDATGAKLVGRLLR